MICPGTRASSTVPGTRARAAAPLAACTEAPAMIIMISGRGRIARALANHGAAGPANGPTARRGDSGSNGRYHGGARSAAAAAAAPAIRRRIMTVTRLVVPGTGGRRRGRGYK